MFNNTTPESKLEKFTLPSNSFYGSGSLNTSNSSTNNSIEMPTTSTPDWKTSKTTRTTFTQSSSRTIIKETFSKQLEPVSREKRISTDSKKSLQSLPVVKDKMEVLNNRSNRSASPDWETSRFSLPAGKIKDLQEDQNENQKEDQQKDHQKKDNQKEKKHQNKKEHKQKDRKSRSFQNEIIEKKSKKEERNRSVSPDWNTSRFSLAPVSPKSASSSPRSSPKNKKTSPVMKRTSTSPNYRSASPDWNTSRFSLPPKSPAVSLKSIHKKISSVSPRISAPLAYKIKTNSNKSMMYKISQKTLDKLLPKPEIHLFDIVKYGPAAPQHKDDFLFGLNLMRSEVLNKIDLLHYKKKLRNTGTDFIRTFQEPRKSKSPTKKSEPDEIKIAEKVVEPEEPVSIEIPDQPDEIVIEDDEMVNVDITEDLNATTEEIDEIDEPEVVIQIEDDVDVAKEVDVESEKLLEEAIQDFADKFGSEVVDETTETSNVIDSNINNSVLINGNESNSAKESVKISETNSFYHSVTKKGNKSPVDLNKSLNTKVLKILKRHSSPNIKTPKKNGSPKKNGIPKKKSPNKKKNIIKVKWPIARKSLLDLRKDS